MFRAKRGPLAEGALERLDVEQMVADDQLSEQEAAANEAQVDGRLKALEASYEPFVTFDPQTESDPRRLTKLAQAMQLVRPPPCHLRARATARPCRPLAPPPR